MDERLVLWTNIGYVTAFSYTFIAWSFIFLFNLNNNFPSDRNAKFFTDADLNSLIPGVCFIIIYSGGKKLKISNSSSKLQFTEQSKHTELQQLKTDKRRAFAIFPFFGRKMSVFTGVEALLSGKRVILNFVDLIYVNSFWKNSTWLFLTQWSTIGWSHECIY